MSLSRVDRLAGCTIPLFSLRSERDWGIGEIADLPLCGAWLKSAGMGLLQLLPAYELAAGETSPYGARTSFGLDPIYITVRDVEDLDPASIGALLGEAGERELARVRKAATVDYAAVRTLKMRALHVAFERFAVQHLARDTARARIFRAFVARETWCTDLALYVALREAHGGYGWETWPEGERTRSRPALEAASKKHERAILEHQYLQWCAHTQWDRARGELRGLGVELMGDVPFIVGGESADVWAHARQFRRDMSLGAPPDAFSPEGQDWGLPVYDWAAMDEDDLSWHRARTKHAARLYDRFRLDHVVGYFRQWVRPRAEGDTRGPGRFDPEKEEAQTARGARVLEVILREAAPAKVIAEDLGVIPPFVRATMKELGLPGYRVIPWEQDELGFREPAGFPESSVASFSTHDTAPITSWWADLPEKDRAALGTLAGVKEGMTDDARLLALTETLMNSGSDLALMLPQELLGEGARINTPGTVGGDNWSYRLPKTLEELIVDEAVQARMARVRELARDAGRTD